MTATKHGDRLDLTLLRLQYRGIKHAYPDTLVLFEVTDGCIALAADIAPVLDLCGALARQCGAGEMAYAHITASNQHAAMAALTASHRRVALAHVTESEATS